MRTGLGADLAAREPESQQRRSPSLAPSSSGGGSGVDSDSNSPKPGRSHQTVREKAKDFKAAVAEAE